MNAPIFVLACDNLEPELTRLGESLNINHLSVVGGRWPGCGHFGIDRDAHNKLLRAGAHKEWLRVDAALGDEGMAMWMALIGWRRPGQVQFRVCRSFRPGPVWEP